MTSLSPDVTFDFSWEFHYVTVYNKSYECVSKYNWE